jgi:epoxyqueuosine reductase
MEFSRPHPLLAKHLLDAGLEWSSILNVQEWHAFFEENKPPAELLADLAFLKSWLKQGHHAGMEFLGNNLHARENINHILPEVASVLSLIIPYATGERTRGRPSFVDGMQTKQHSESKSLLKRTARYARVPDYHKVIRRELDRVLQLWESDAQAAGLVSEKTTWRVVTDALPFLDRAHARIGGLGFIGKNTMLIRPGTGSYFFIAHVLLSVPYGTLADPTGQKPLAADAIAELSCGDCTRCLDACPTQALVGPRHLDANKCLSYLSIEHRDIVPEAYLKHFSERFYGCDICQEVCPYNLRTLELKTVRSFQKNISALEQLSAADVAAMTQAQYENWFGGTAMTRAKYAGLVRNALYSLYADRDSRLSRICESRAGDPNPLIQKTVEQLLKLNSE